MPSERNGIRRRRLVIVGGGFGGLAAARKLRRADVDVTLVDRMNHHLFQPLLYQAAAGGLSSSDCASPIRPALKRGPNISVLMGEATDLDPERRQVVLDRGERLDYDSLIVACGAETSYFGRNEWGDVTVGVKTLADAVALRERFYGALEEAERTDDEAARNEWLTFVVVGGGPTGVEVAGQLAITAKTMKRDFRRIAPGRAKVILLDAGDRLVAAFSEKLSGKVARYLDELGVTVREGARATAIDDRGVTIDVAGANERIDSRTVIWAAGVRAVPFTEVLAGATGPRRTAAAGCVSRPHAAGSSGDLGDQGHRRVKGPGRCPVGDGRDPAGAPRGQGDPLGALGASTPFRCFERGRAGGRRPRRGVARSRGIAGWASRVLHLPGRAPVLPRGARPDAHRVR